MNPAQHIPDPPLERGFMKSGFFAWPKVRRSCPGYTLRGVVHACGVEIESYSRKDDVRCVACRKQHYKEWKRLNYAKRRKTT